MSTIVWYFLQWGTEFSEYQPIATIRGSLMRLTLASEAQERFPDLRIVVSSIGGVKFVRTDSSLEELVREKPAKSSGNT